MTRYIVDSYAWVEYLEGSATGTAVERFLEGAQASWTPTPVVAEVTSKAIRTGKATGWIPPEAALAAGAVGTIVNHSERKVAWEEMRDLINKCRVMGLEVVVCADDVAEAETAAKLGPDFLAIEPPELIGGTVSVTTAKPGIITKAVDRIHATNPKVQVLCGAGVKTGRDVARALELGAVGVLLASGVVKAKSPEKVLRDLAKGLVRAA